MKIKSSAVLVIVLVIGVGTISVSKAMGIWETQSEKIPDKYVSEGKTTGDYKASDIKGSYTFGDVSNLYGIPLAQLATSFHVDKKEAENFKCSELGTVFEESTYEIGVESVRAYVAFYLGQSYDLSADVYFTKEGAEGIKAYGKPTEPQLVYLENHIVGSSGIDGETQSGTAGESKGTGANQTIEVKGADYFKDVSKTYDVPLNILAQAFNLSSDKADYYQVKDLKTEYPSGEITPGSVKLFIALYKGLDYDLNTSQSYLTKEGSALIKQNKKASKEQLTYLETHTMP